MQARRILQKIIFVHIFLILIITKPCISSEDEKIETISCPNDLLCSKENSACVQNGTEYYCECKKGFTTYPEDSNIKCNYEEKGQLKAFLLEFFLSYGAGHFYVHNYKLAIPKLIVFAFFYCLFIALRIITKAKEENRCANLIICISAGVTFVGMLVWQIIDLVFFGKNKYNDGNNIELKSWK